MTLAFLLTSFLVVVSPGAGVLYMIANGLSRGRRSVLPAALGCTLGIVPHLAAAILGLAALMHESALAFQALKYAGVAYLLYMAFATLRADGALKIEAKAGAASALRIAATAVAINLLNPKLSIFFFAFLPQFIPAAAPDALSRMLALSAIFMLMTFLVFLVYGFFAATLRSQVIERPSVLAWLRRGFAAGFLALGAKLAWAEA